VPQIFHKQLKISFLLNQSAEVGRNHKIKILTVTSAPLGFAVNIPPYATIVLEELDVSRVQML
jgi:hypothetical protein